MAERSREAISTIKGYYYQFDYYVLQLLNLQNDSDSVRIEGKAIRPMLIHFSKNKDKKLSYKLYGHYSSGEDSITLPLTVEYIKAKFFTYTENQVKHVLHDDLGLSDDDLKKFLKRLKIQLHAETYESQIEKIVACIKEELHCPEYDARYFYYNNAVAFVKEVAVNKTPEARTIKKRCFIEKIGTKRILFDRWYIEHVGFEKYYKESRSRFFSRMNVSSIQRFFLVECDASVNDTDIAGLIMKVSGKWSKLSMREKNPVCPFFYLHGITTLRLANVKKILFDNDFHIWDGYEYKDAEFSATSIVRPVNCYLCLKARIINKVNQIDTVLEECTGTKEIYQFYSSKPFYINQSKVHRLFQVQNAEDVLKIV